MLVLHLLPRRNRASPDFNETLNFFGILLELTQRWGNGSIKVVSGKAGKTPWNGPMYFEMVAGSGRPNAVVRMAHADVCSAA